jgi:hypothetical protein
VLGFGNKAHIKVSGVHIGWEPGIHMVLCKKLLSQVLNDY